MFEGTVRSNLDPLEEYSDEQIWEVCFVYSIDGFDFPNKRRKGERNRFT